MYKVSYIFQKYKKFKTVVVSVNKSFILKMQKKIMKNKISKSYQTFVLLRYRRNLFRKVKVTVMFVLL